ncbi:type IV pilus biogenesis/stability protein PilW [Rubrivivax gelatinosus]|nr:type IV pilus biogenesis/stability protein PilW [Rubrivivax gelatinosus]
MRLATVLLVLFSAVVAACVGQPTAVDGSREIRTASDQTDADRRARVRLELASAYFTRGQTTTALDEVKLALAARPDLPEALGLRGLIYAALGEPALAEESFKRALSIAPRDADMRHNYGWFLCQERRYVDADREFDGALAQPQYRGAARTLLAKGVCDARENRWADAEAALFRSFQLDASSPATAYNLADVLYRRGDLERARFYVQRVNAVAQQSNAQSLWLAARIERRLGNLASTRELGRQLRDRFPQSSEAVLFEQGRFDD